MTYPFYVERSGAVRSLVGPNYVLDGETLICGEGVTPPTEEAIQAEIVRLKAEYDDLEYSRKRKAEYPNLAELTIALYDTDDKAAIETKRAAVKTKWPKDNSGPV